MFRAIFRNIDWVLILAIVPILAAGLITMSSFDNPGDPILIRQLVWVGLSFIVCVFISRLDIRIFTRTNILITLYIIGCLVLVLVLLVGSTINGATSWFQFGGFSFQPSDPMKVVLILVLAKYLSRRHVEIAHPRHLFITGMYALVPFLLVLIQPDLGSALIFGAIWFGMVLVAGISRKHLLILAGGMVFVSVIVWFFVLAPYQKARIENFIHPLANVTGSGYNANQSAIAVGSGQWFGKGLGSGTQSRLNFLPEYKTDFIFAAFAEEWGFVGAGLLIIFFLLLLRRIIKVSEKGSSNFEILLGTGVAIYFLTHIVINVGMNLTILPVTGITLPFMSHGGSHLITEFLALGLLMAAQRGERVAHKDDTRYEFLGLE